MGHPVVHFEIIGTEPAKLRGYYGELFGWEFDTSPPVAEAVSEVNNYGFIERNSTGDGVGIPGELAEVPGTRAIPFSTWASPTWRQLCKRRRASGASVRWVLSGPREGTSWSATSLIRKAT